MSPILTPYKTPVVDTSNAIGSLAEMMGPTPAEREARERKLQKGRAQMQAWAGMFDGLRQLGNLYYTAKGAPSQQLQSPSQQIDNVYEQERQRNLQLDDYRQRYAQQLYALSRQAAADKRQDALAQAHANLYETQSKVAQQNADQKAELDRLKAVKVIKNYDGSLIKYDPVTGTTELLTEGDPLYKQYKQSQISRNYRANTGGRGANNGTYGHETITTQGVDENGQPWKKVVRKPTTGVSATNPVKPSVTTTHPKPNPKKQPNSKTTKTNKSGFFNS